MRHSCPPGDLEIPIYLVSPGWFIYVMHYRHYTYVNVQLRPGWMSTEPSCSKMQKIEVSKDLLVRYQERLMTNMSRSTQHVHVSLFPLWATQWLVFASHLPKYLTGLAKLCLLHLPNHSNLTTFAYCALIFRFCSPLSDGLDISVHGFGKLLSLQGCLTKGKILDSYWLLLEVADQSCPIPHLVQLLMTLSCVTMHQIAVQESPMMRWYSQGYTVPVVQRRFEAGFSDSF